MSESQLRFGRTESWTSGWRGKRSATEIRRGTEVVGEIKGEEFAAVGGMEYTITLDGREFQERPTKLMDAKAIVKRAEASLPLNGVEDDS